VGVGDGLKMFAQAYVGWVAPRKMNNPTTTTIATPATVTISER
jgi:hypothetical protein